MAYDHVLVDGRNILYRAVFAELGKFMKPGEEVHEPRRGIVVKVFLRFLREYLERFRPGEMHVFWDDTHKSLWRREVYPDYKANRKSQFPGMGQFLHRQFAYCLSVLEPMGLKQYLRDGQEADDLLYAFCASTTDRCAVISGDGDLLQIPQAMSHVDLFGPNAKDRGEGPKEVPPYFVVVKKALMGDKSDNIAGYAGIGEKRSTDLAMDESKLTAFLNSEKAVALVDKDRVHVGSQVFLRNVELIHLGMSPHLDENIDYVRSARKRSLSYDHPEVLRALRKYTLKPVMEDSTRLCVPFSSLGR